MKRKFYCILTAIVMSIVCVFANVSVTAETDPLYLYKQRLVELNSQYGTDLTIPEYTAQGNGYSEIVEFYSSLTMEEFDEYIISVIDNSIYDTEHETLETSEESGNSISPRIATQKQYYYYTGSTNKALTITTQVQYADGHNRYTSVGIGGHWIKSYPAYKVNSFTYSITNSRRNLTVNYNVTTFLTAYLSQTAIKHVIVTYDSDGKDVYGSLSV